MRAIGTHGVDLGLYDRFDDGRSWGSSAGWEGVLGEARHAQDLWVGVGGGGEVEGGLREEDGVDGWGGERGRGVELGG